MDAEPLKRVMDLHEDPDVGCGAVCLFFGSLSVFAGPILVLAALGAMSPAPTVSVLAIELTPETSAPAVIVFGVLLLLAGLGVIAFGLYSLTHKCRMVFDDESGQLLYHYSHLFRRIENAHAYSDIVAVKLTPNGYEDDIDAVGMRLSIAFSDTDEVEIGIRDNRDTLESIAKHISDLSKTCTIG
jgi:hypothetical protein